MGGRVVSRDGGKLSFRPSIPKTALTALGSAFFVVACGGFCLGWLGSWVVDFPKRVAETNVPALSFARLLSLPVFLICAGGVLFFGWGLFHCLGQLLFFRRPILEICSEGVLDRASGVSVGFAPREEIRSVEPYTTRGQRSVTIRVKNDRELLARQNPAKRLLIKANRRYFETGEINIPLNALAIPDHTGLQGEARARLRFSSDEADPGEGERPESAGARALRIVGSVARWTALVLLSLVYLVVSVLLLVPGMMFAWNSIGPGSAPGLDRPVARVVLLALGTLFFVFFPRLVKKLTGREVLFDHHQ